MARTPRLPAYTLHKPSGQARVYIDGKSVYLGEFGSEKSRIAYGEVIARHAAGLPIDPLAKGKSSDGPDADTGPTIAELLLGYWHHANEYYRGTDGKPTSEIHCLRSALKPLRQLFEFTPADEFTPLMLKTVRQKYIEAGWTRLNINKCVSRIRSVFRWGVENGLVSVNTWTALKALSALSAGRSAAVEGRKRSAVSEDQITAVRSHLSQRNRDLLDLMLLTASRPSEILSVTWNLIDRTADVWVVDLVKHKNSHRGKSRKIHFGPKSQAILLRYVDTPPNERIFPSRRDTFSQAIADACTRAKVAKFVPHELRHTAATRIRDNIGIEAAQAMCGHASPDMTAHYSSRMDGIAAKTAAQVG